MTDSPQDKNLEFFQRFWAEGVEVYENHPTSRHRRRFVSRSLRGTLVRDDFLVFDYGCGSGAVLREAKALLNLRDDQVGGCDLSPVSIDLMQRLFQSPHFRVGSYPEFDRPIDVAVCTEVIEHTPEYEKILAWLHARLRPNGLLILTTPNTPMDPPDVAYGHTQHFEIGTLCALLKRLGYTVEFATRWGFPLFTLQKFVTRNCYRHIERRVINAPLSLWTRAVFSFAYGLYFVHDCIPVGPQLFIRARRA